MVAQRVTRMKWGLGKKVPLCGSRHAYMSSAATEVPLLELKRYASSLSTTASAQVPPKESNYLIQNSFGVFGIRGTIIEHYGNRFTPSTTTLKHHLQLEGVTADDRLRLTPEQWRDFLVASGKSGSVE
jgi:hypothetical protein